MDVIALRVGRAGVGGNATRFAALGNRLLALLRVAPDAAFDGPSCAWSSRGFERRINSSSVFGASAAKAGRPKRRAPLLGGVCLAEELQEAWSSPSVRV